MALRTIIFRGKRLDNGEWSQGDLLQLFDGRRYIVANRFGACIDSHGNFINTEAPFVNEVDPATIGQYTGLDDTDGEPIYENDILCVRDDGGKEIYRFVVAYGVCGGVQNTKRDVGYVGFHVIPANEETQRLMDLGARNDILYWLDSYDCYVIGNIHDNPELLEVRHE